MSGMTRLLKVVEVALLALLLAASTLRAASTLTGDLPRRADLGFTWNVSEETLEVRAVEPGSAADAAGLEEGDRIVSIQGREPSTPLDGRVLLRRLAGGLPVALEVERAGERRALEFEPPPLPLEDIPGYDSHYGDLRTSDGAWLRTIVSRPEGARGAVPALFVVQWVSCGSIEFDPESGSRRMFVEAARASGRTLLRVDRSASGDSQGPECHELDYDTELAHYVEPFGL